MPLQCCTGLLTVLEMHLYVLSAEQPDATSGMQGLFQSDVVLGQTSQSVSYRPRYDACRNIGVGLKMVTTLTLVVYTCIMGIEPPTKS